MRILMCPPAYYGIEYEINPWMSRSRPSDPIVAHEQWRALYELVQHRLGMEVLLMEARPGLPDMVFTANAGLVWENKFIVSNFRHQARRGEAAHFENWFAARNYEIVHLPARNHFEGEGDLLMCGDRFFAGYPNRSSILSHKKLAKIIEREVLPLKLINDWFYHLDTCFCPLSANQAICYPAAFDADSLSVLEKTIDGLIAVDEAEARRFACNAIVLEKNVIMNDGCPNIHDRLESLGFSVFELSFTEFIKAGGSAKCLVLKLPHGKA
jgi:N-dimethylarginine dimethylaminohydrolase